LKRTLPVVVVLGIVGGGMLLTGVVESRYFYFATYVILQYIVLSTAWNILGGYTGYVNFGTPAFFALGAYTATLLMLLCRAPLLMLILAGGLTSGLLGLGIGYLTLRLKGVFFSIATLALTVVLQTLIINWEFVGGAKGISIIRPAAIPFFSGAYRGRTSAKPPRSPTEATLSSTAPSPSKGTPLRNSASTSW
jgi:branched-chain amino acid transport system permease protein